MITRTYKVKLRPAKRAHERLDEVLRDNCRLYNAALEHRRWAWKMGQTSISLYDQSRELTQVRADDQAFGDVHRTIQVGTLRRLDKAFDAFFRRVKSGDAPGFPRFRSSRRFRSLTIDNNVQARGMLKLRDGGKGFLRIKGLPRLPFRCRRELPETEHLAEIRIVRTPRRVEAHLVYRMQTEVPQPPANPQNGVGLDMGIHEQVTTSNGRTWPGYVKNTRRLKRLQRRVSRAKRGSNGRRKKVLALAREADRLTAQRQGWAHELSATLVNGGHDLIAAEALQIKDMLERRSDELPRQVEARINRGINQQAWGDLLQKIEYKAESAGIRFEGVDPAYTTQDCSRCGTRVPKAIGTEVHHCASCGLKIGRRVNAALNVLRLGLAQAAGGNLAGAQEARLSTAPDGAGLRRKPRSPGQPDIA